MNIQEVSIDNYDNMTLEEKETFYRNVSMSHFSFIPAIRQRQTKNMKTRGVKQVHGHLTFVDELRRIDKKVTNFFYLCLCDCGNWHIITNRHFDTEDIISCGCYRKERGAEMCKQIGVENYIDIINHVYGDLKVIKKTDERKHDGIVWECQCVKCGHIQKAQGRLLRLGKKSFCEKCSERKSKGERLISTLLEINNIPYEKEKSFDTCRFKDTNRPALFDFWVDNTYLIEFDGEQHFSPQSFNNISKSEAQVFFEKTQQHDNYKNQWCKENNISLIRIPYTHLNQLCLKDIQLTKDNPFLLKDS